MSGLILGLIFFERCIGKGVHGESILALVLDDDDDGGIGVERTNGDIATATIARRANLCR